MNFVLLFFFNFNQKTTTSARKKMASKGKYVIGTDGTDYQHRQRVVSAHSFR